MAETATPERDVEVLEKTTPYRGFFRMDVYRLRHRKFDGGWTQELSREVFERGHAVAVLPYDPERDRVILIEQFRIGAYAAGLDAWLLETVAGVIEESESAQDVARREAHEEAGCDITDLVPIAEIMLSPLGDPGGLLRAGRQPGRRRDPRPGPRGRGHPGPGAAAGGRPGTGHGDPRRQRQCHHPPAMAPAEPPGAAAAVVAMTAEPLARPPLLIHTPVDRYSPSASQ
jgi:8-oxo-dGTP pyrophosphatase MutT (NUDIX family)